MDYKEQVQESVEKEFTGYKNAMCERDAAVVFDNSYKNLFYINMYDFFSDEDFMDESIYENLSKDGALIIASMWHMYLKWDGYSTENWEDIYRLCKDYVEYTTAPAL